MCETFSDSEAFTLGRVRQRIPQKLKRPTQILTALLVLIVFGGTIWVAKEQLADRVREQALTRQAEVLQAIALVHQVSVIEAFEDLSMENHADQLIVMEEISELSGALGFRLYSPEANYLYSYPETITEGALGLTQFKKAETLSPSASLTERALLSDWVDTGVDDVATERVPILEIVLPLHIADEEQLLGIAQLIFDGDDTLADIEQLGQQISVQSSVVFAVGAVIIAVVLGFSFRSINRSHDRLAKRTAALNEANQALALSNKTTAIGGIASHLMHGLRNPLAALKTLFSNTDDAKLNLAEAKEAISRMEFMVEDVLRTLRDYQGGIVYEITMRELLGLFENNFSAAATKRSVALQIDIESDFNLENREASLILLIIENLAHNAVEACPMGGTVRIDASRDGIIAVSDDGPGLPEGTQEQLFQAGKSTKEQGSGLGLAISRQLAISIDADLRLAKSDENGTTFELSLAKRGA